VAFELAAGDLSGIVQVGDKFVILKCEGRTESISVTFDEVRDILYQDIFEKKLRLAMSDKFAEIRTKARIDNYLAGTSQAPERVRDQRAGTAGTPANTRAGARVDSAVRPATGPSRNRLQ
jgi:hypothetical protein